MKTPWTPGPWKTGNDGKPHYWWRGQVIGQKDGGDFVLATCNQNYTDIAIPNANLISLAPEMAEAILELTSAQDKIGRRNAEEKLYEIARRLREIGGQDEH